MAGFLRLFLGHVIITLMKIVYRFLLVAIFTFPLFIGSCKEQYRCGCDTDVLNSLLDAPVVIYYDEENKSAEFVPEINAYARYYFCNPSEMMPQLVNFENGAMVLLSGEVFYECNYMYQASNSYYGSMYQAYMVTVTEIKEDLYGN